MGTVKFEVEIEENTLKALKKYIGTVQIGRKQVVKKISGEVCIKKLFYIGAFWDDLDLTGGVKVRLVKKKER